MTRELRFSQRQGITRISKDIQRGSIDSELRNKLWNIVLIHFFDNVEGALQSGSYEGLYEGIIKRLWIHFFKLPLDTLDKYWSQVQRTIRKQFYEWKWDEVYDFIEALAQQLQILSQKRFIATANSFLEDEMSAYRFVDDKIVEMTSEHEIAVIEDAIANTSPFAPVQTHLREALAKLSDRKNPDYRNSIKESISAVESICRMITKDKKATLGQAIKKLEDNGIQLHSTIESAWNKLYGYASDEDGIRHSLLNQPNITFGSAKYMLGSCSAFVSYLLDLARDANISLKR